jgi:hypothetical protein
VSRAHAGAPPASCPVKADNRDFLSGLCHCILPAVRSRVIAWNGPLLVRTQTSRELRATM